MEGRSGREEWKGGVFSLDRNDLRTRPSSSRICSAIWTDSNLIQSILPHKHTALNFNTRPRPGLDNTKVTHFAERNAV